MMTTQTRTLIQVSDIAGIETYCSKCRSRVYFPVATTRPDEFRSKVHRCPNCNAVYADDVHIKRIAELIQAVKVLAQNEDKAALSVEIIAPVPPEPQ